MIKGICPKISYLLLTASWGYEQSKNGSGLCKLILKIQNSTLTVSV